MKYKVGDRVRIKTWEEMEKEFGLSQHGSIKGMPIYFTPKKEAELMKLYPNRILTINFVANRGTLDIYGFYFMEGLKYEGGEEYKWFDKEIECLVKKPVYIPIKNRWEILDL